MCGADVCVVLRRELSYLAAQCSALFSYMWFLVDLSFGKACLRITSAKVVQVVVCVAYVVTIFEQLLWCGFFHMFPSMA